MSNIHKIDVASDSAYLELWQYDSGQILEFDGTDIADDSNVLFSGPKTRKAFRRVCENNRVAIPNKLLRETGKIQVTVETFTENEETTIYEFSGYIKRRQEGGLEVEPEDEPTVLQRILAAIKKLGDDITDLFTNKADKTDLNALSDDVDNLKNSKQDKLNDGDGIKINDGEISIDKLPGEDNLIDFLEGKLRVSARGAGYNQGLRNSLKSDTGGGSGFVDKTYIANILLDYGKTIALSVDPQTYVCTFQLKNGNTVLSTASIDLPLETMVLDVDYDSQTKELVITLKSGTVRRVDVSAIVSGLVSVEDFENAIQDIQDALDEKQDKITAQNKLSADLLESGNTNKVVTQSEKDAWNGKQDALTESDTVHIDPSGNIKATEAKYVPIKTIDLSELSEPVSMIIVSEDEEGESIAFDDFLIDAKDIVTSADNSKFELEAFINNVSTSVISFSKANVFGSTSKSVFVESNRRNQSMHEVFIGGSSNQTPIIQRRVITQQYQNKINRIRICTNSTFLSGSLTIYGRNKF